jgi:hypothetical protein
MSRLKILVVPAWALLLAAPVWAQSNTNTTNNTKSATAKVAGMQVAIDPHTGRLRQPTPAERQALAKALGRSLNRSTEGLTVTRFPNGMQKVDLQGRFQNTSVATVDEHGRVSHRCITTEAEAKRIMASPSVAKKQSSAAEVK